MQKIIYTQAAVDRLQELLEVLYQEGYVGFEDSAEDYVRDIFSFIAILPQQRHRSTKNPRWGKWYCSYPRNRRTTWFI